MKRAALLLVLVAPLAGCASMTPEERADLALLLTAGLEKGLEVFAEAQEGDLETALAATADELLANIPAAITAGVEAGAKGQPPDSPDALGQVVDIGIPALLALLLGKEGMNMRRRGKERLTAAANGRNGPLVA